MFDMISEHMCSDTTFLSDQNPYNTLAVYIIIKAIYPVDSIIHPSNNWGQNYFEQGMWYRIRRKIVQ